MKKDKLIIRFHLWVDNHTKLRELPSLSGMHLPPRLGELVLLNSTVYEVHQVMHDLVIKPKENVQQVNVIVKHYEGLLLNG